MLSLPSTTSNYRCAALAFKHTLRPCPKRRISTHSNESPEDCDVVIVGGGPAGLALASALGSSQAVSRSLSITLVEAGDLKKINNWTPTPTSYSNRVSSLTNASQDFLKRIGAWDHVEGLRTCSVEEMQVWDGVSDARIRFSASELGIRDASGGMAQITENLNLQRGLLAQLETLPTVRLLQKTKLNSISRGAEENGGWPLVHLDNGSIFRSRLLVGADGFNSPVRSYAGIPSFGWSYETQAIVATMEHPPRSALELPNTTAYQRFLPTGPIAFLPLSPTVSSLVWSTQPLIAKALLASDPGVLASMINAAFRLPHLSLNYLQDRVLEAYNTGTLITPSKIRDEIIWREEAHSIDRNSAFSSIVRANPQTGIPPENSDAVPPLVHSLQPGTIASFPLRLNHAETYIGEGQGSRTVLVGDAAHTVHPLAGQGLNLGLGDADCLARCIEHALLRGGDVGSYTALLPYAQQRYLQNHTMMAAIDKLHKIYSTDLGPIVWARTVGLEVINELDSVKAAIMLAAGAETQTASNQSEWDLTAKAVENLVATVNVAKTVASGVQDALLSGISNYFQPKGGNNKTHV